MRFESTSYTELFTSAASKLANRTGITSFGQSSKAGALLNTFIEDDKQKVSQINEVLNSFKLPTATGKDLVAKGEILGVYKLQETRAYTKIIDSNLEFYVDSGTFGDSNNGDDYLFPANEIVYLESKDADSGRRIEYRLTSSVLCPKNSSSVFFAVEAVQAGTASSVAAGALNKHTNTNQTIKVRNNYAISNGRDEQSDSSYRSMITKAFTSYAMCNEASIRMAASVIPGIREVKIFRNYNGIGTTTLMVDGFEGTLGQSTLELVKNRVSSFASTANLVSVYSPKYVGIELSLVIKTSLAFSNAEKIKLSKNIITTIKNYFRTFSIGQSVDLQNLFNLIIRVNANIVQIGIVPGSNTFSSASAFFSDLNGVFSEKRVLTDFIPVQMDQRAILMTSNTPIVLTIEKI